MRREQEGGILGRRHEASVVYWHHAHEPAVSGAGRQRGWDTEGLGHRGAGRQRGWETEELRHRGAGTQRGAAPEMWAAWRTIIIISIIGIMRPASAFIGASGARTGSMGSAGMSAGAGINAGSGTGIAC